MPTSKVRQLPKKSNLNTRAKIAISKSALQSGKITQQQYDDVVNRKFEKNDRFIDQAPGNGD